MLTKFEGLIGQLQDIATLSGIASLLGWDQETYMPRGAIASRSAQSSLLATVIHQRYQSEGFKKALGQWVDLESGGMMDEKLPLEETVFLKEVYRDWRLATAVPHSFVKAYSELKTTSQFHWDHAKQSDDYTLFSPWLARVISMTTEYAGFLDSTRPAYDVLFDLYEPGMTPSELVPVFDRLKLRSVQILDQCDVARPVAAFMHGPFDLDQQWGVGLDILKAMNYDFDKGRQDRSSHPFTTHFHPTDVRITTRLSESNVMEGLSSTIHEGGHALFEQGLDIPWFGTPFGSATSLGVHESQSRLWEIFIGKSRGFWEGVFPNFQKRFSVLADVTLDQFYREINHVKPSLIRVESDELTYNLHIMIRFDLERRLFSGELDVVDLKDAWDSAYDRELGIRPDCDRNGILQDVHWSMGAFGYFPTYTIGNLYAAQLYETLQRDLPNFDSIVRSGDYGKITAWLRESIHRVGRRMSAKQLMAHVTGTGFSEAAYVRYLERKFLL